MKSIKAKQSKREYVPPLLAKYDSLNKITLGPHAHRGQCPNYPNDLSTASCALSGVAKGAYRGGKNHGCCS